MLIPHHPDFWFHEAKPTIALTKNNNSFKEFESSNKVLNEESLPKVCMCVGIKTLTAS